MKKDFNNKLITLSDGFQYVILDQTDYKGINYVLLGEVTEGKLGSNITLFKVDDTERFIEENDLEIVETVLAKLA